MLITKKTGYALRALLQMDYAGKNNPLSLRTICEKQNLPFKFMEQIVRKLKKAQLIKSKPGAHGGYYLSRELNDISLYELINALEENLNVFECDFSQDNLNSYCDGENCSLLNFWHNINNDIVNYLKNINLISALKNKRSNNE